MICDSTSRFASIFSLLFVISASVCVASDANALCLSPPGDVTGSGSTNVTDVQCMILGTLAELSGDSIPICAAVQTSDIFDQDCNLSINVADVLIVIALSLQQPLGNTLDADEDGCVDACLEVAPPQTPWRHCPMSLTMFRRSIRGRSATLLRPTLLYIPRLTSTPLCPGPW